MRAPNLSVSPAARSPWLIAPLATLLACSGPQGSARVAPDSLHVRILATHDLHGAPYSAVYPWSNGRPVGGIAAVDAVMDTLQAACACPTLRLDGGDQMQGTLASNLTHGAAMVAALDHLRLDAAAVGNHELDWGVDTLLARQQAADYEWLAANVFNIADGERPEWATPFTVIERKGIRVGVIGYSTVSTPRTLRAEATAAYEFRAGYAGLREALDEVRRQAPDFVVVVAHAAGNCGAASCAGETIDLANELPPGSVDLIVGGHDHEPGGGVASSSPIVRAGSNGQGVGVVDLVRRSDGTRSHSLGRVPVFADSLQIDPAMVDLLAPYLRMAGELGGVRVTTLAERLSSSASGDRRLGSFIAEAARRQARADFGLHNPGGVRIDLPDGPITYADLHRVMPFDNTVVRLVISGKQLRRLAEQVGPRSYFANLVITYAPDTVAPRFGRAMLAFPEGRQVVDDESYTLATNDFLADGGDGLVLLTELARDHTGVTTLDAVGAQLRALPPPVTLPMPVR